MTTDEAPPETVRQANTGVTGLFRALRPLAYLLRPYRVTVLAALAAGVVSQVTLVAAGTLGAYLVGRAVTGATADDLRTSVIVLVVLVILQAVLLVADSMLAHIAAFRTLADMRRRCYEAFERLSPTHLSWGRSGDHGAAMMDDVELLELFFAHTLSPFLAATTVPAAAIIALLVLAWPVALVLLPFVVAIAIIPRYLRDRSLADGRTERSAVGDLNAQLVDAVQGAREVLAASAGDRMRALLRQRGLALRDAQVVHARRTGAERATVDLLSGGGVLTVLIVAAILVSRGQLSAPLLPTVAILAGAAFVPVAAFADAAKELGRVIAASGRLADLLARPALVADHGTHVPAHQLTPVVRFTDVHFRYAADLPEAATGVSFEMYAGETLALAGASGAGKSTCAALLLRLYDVTGGRITIDGIDVRDLPDKVLRTLVAVVPQDVYLFSEPLDDNLRIARPDADEAALIEAAERSLVAEFIPSLPEGYRTPVGERGLRLSGGQRQRVAIARALLRDTPVLVLDEAVSSLDTESEELLQAGIDEVTRDRTTLVIAHRLSTLRAADRIVVLEHGAVVETGPYDDLVAAGGHFARLVGSGLDQPATAPE